MLNIYFDMKVFWTGRMPLKELKVKCFPDTNHPHNKRLQIVWSETDINLKIYDITKSEYLNF